MEHNVIFEKVRNVFIEEFEIEESQITENSLIFTELGLDSLDSVDLIVALEKTFQFKIDRANDGPIIAQIKSIADIMNYVKLKKATC